MSRKQIPFRFVAHIGGAVRELLSVREMKDGSLIIAMRFLPKHGFDADGPALSEMRATIHYSNDPHHSRLNFHYKTVNGQSISPAIHWTKAIKSDKFAFVASYYCGWPLHPSFDPSKNAGETIVLREYPDTNVQLIYSIFVGSANSQFDESAAIKADMNCTKIIIGQFKLVIISEIETIGSNLLGYISRASTIDPAGLPPEQAAVIVENMEGHDGLHSTALAALRGEVAIYKIIDCILNMKNRRNAHPGGQDFNVHALLQRQAIAREGLIKADAWHYIEGNYTPDDLVAVSARWKGR